MRLGKLRLLSATCVVIAIFALVEQLRSNDSLWTAFMIPLLLLASAIELIRLELRDLQNKNAQEKKRD